MPNRPDTMQNFLIEYFHPEGSCHLHVPTDVNPADGPSCALAEVNETLQGNASANQVGMEHKPTQLISKL